MKALRRLFLALILMALIVAAGTFVPRPLWASGKDHGETRRILVLTNPIHTDIAIPIDADVRRRFAFLENAGIPMDHPQARWLVFGWGGRAFYLETPTWGELKLVPVLKALTADRSVLHVDLVGEIPYSHPAVTSLEIGADGLSRMTEFIAGSFRHLENEPMLIAGRGYGSTDQFYEAEGWFNALVGCNTWTAKALREAGLQTGWWNPMPVTLATSLQLHN